MRAVVIYPGEPVPVIEDRAQPVPIDKGQVLLKVKAVALKNLDISKAMGKHYSSKLSPEGQIVGTDGVGITPEGNRVYGFSKHGMLATYSLIDPHFCVPIPDGLDDARAAAIPNAVMGSAMALLYRARLQPGETVLINGATGVTGRMAIQIARYYQAGKIIVTGRNQDLWPELKALGADRWITLEEAPQTLSATISQQHLDTPIDIVLDYLWGSSAAAILAGLKGDGAVTHATRYISIGGMAGDTIALSSSILRSTAIQLMGSGLGSWSREEVGVRLLEMIPVFYRLAAEGKLRMQTKVYNLEQIGEVWNAKLPSGIRAVIQIS